MSARGGSSVAGPSMRLLVFPERMRMSTYQCWPVMCPSFVGTSRNNGTCRNQRGQLSDSPVRHAPRCPGPESQIWVRAEASAPWVMDIVLTPDGAGRWVKSDPEHVASVEDLTWCHTDGIRCRPRATRLRLPSHHRAPHRRSMTPSPSSLRAIFESGGSWPRVMSAIGGECRGQGMVQGCYRIHLTLT